MLFCGTCLRYGQQQTSSSQHSQIPLDFSKQPHWECWAQLAHVCPAPSLVGPLPLPHTPGGWGGQDRWPLGGKEMRSLERKMEVCRNPHLKICCL